MLSGSSRRRWRREWGLIACLSVAAATLLACELGYREWSARYDSAIASLAASARLHSLSARIAEADAAQRSFALNPSPDSSSWEYSQSYRTAIHEIRTIVSQLRPHYAMHPDPVADQYFHALTAAIGAKLGEIELTLELNRRDHDRAMEVIGSGIGERTMDNVRHLIQELSRREEFATRDSAHEWREKTTLSRLGIGLAALLNAALLAALFSRLKRDWRSAREREALLDLRVRERTQQLASLASRLQEAAEAERASLARELHDELGSLLIASKLDISWVRQRLGPECSELRDKLGRVLHHLDQGVVAKRRIVEGLRPSALGAFGLAAAVRQLSEQVAERAGWALDMELPEVEQRLPEDLEIALFRVLQESLTNAAKYAQASTVAVRLRCTRNRCTLEVQDDGRGFRLDKMNARTHGLAGMRQRIESRNGELIVRTAPGKGTCVLATLPCPETQTASLAEPHRALEGPNAVPKPATNAGA